MLRGALGAGRLTRLWWAGRIRFPTNSCRMNEAQRFCYIFQSFSVSELENVGRGRSKRNDLAAFLLVVPHGSEKPQSTQKTWGQ